MSGDQRPQKTGVLELARRQEDEDKELARFFRELRETFRRKDIVDHGRATSLYDYLSRRRESAKDGDEQRVVDSLVRQLLGVLGYEGASATYNEPQPGTGERAIPDWTVRAPEYLAAVPVFLVEDKSTTIRDFHQVRRGRDTSEESPLDQLRRYVLSGAVHARVGMICNGWRWEAWQFAGDDGDTRLVEVDLFELARLAESESEEAFPGAQEPALRTLWSRFSHAAFLRARDLGAFFQELSPPPDDWSGDLPSYHEHLWQRDAIDVSASPEILVEALRGLIEQFAEDVLHQLVDSLRRFRSYQDLRREMERQSRLPRLLQPIALREPSFTLGKEEFEIQFLYPLGEWCRNPRPEETKGRIAEWIGQLEPWVRAPNGSPTSAEQMTLGAQPPAKKTLARTHDVAETKKRDLLEALSRQIEALTREALEEFSALRQLAEDHRSSIRVGEAYRTWIQRVSSSVLVGATEEILQREFARQTAYVYIIRLLLVRICEDKGLFRRKLSDGGLALWQEHARQYLDYASGRSYEYLTRMAYECAQNVYVHFYGASELFDWYRMDDKMLLRALRVLNAFQLAGIDTDIIGAVYGRYLEEGKHEQGRYYTPKPLVKAMLDLMDYQGDQIVNRRIADLACGSGSFLVDACRRLLDGYRDRDGRIPTSRLGPALEDVQRSLWGIELNPFACYLAETNLLIQVLDVVRQARDASIHLAVDRFRIYCADSLIVDPAIAQASDATLYLLGRDRATAELLKAKAGAFREGFDYLIGNPPYVRADEEGASFQAYRRRLEREDWFTTRHLKWDLYVPFVEQYHRLLSERPEARACLVTIESISTAPYAQKLRELLLGGAILHDIVFAEGLRLFEDASWQDNVIFSYSKAEPATEHHVRRWTAQKVGGTLKLETLDEQLQKQLTSETVFNRRPRIELSLKKTVPLETICYVTKGMVLHSNERLKEGEILLAPASYDPARFDEMLVEDLGEGGKRIRHKSFVRDDLIAQKPDEIHVRPYLDSREVLRGGIGRKRWLEYGPHTRCPARVSRPTFPELYDRPKIVFGAFVGVAVDDGEDDGFAMVPHTVRLAILWHRLSGVENRSLATARDQLASTQRYDPRTSKAISEWYLCALALSEPIQAWMYSRKRSMKGDVYPEDIKEIPIKILSPRKQEPFIGLEQERHQLWRDLLRLEDDGFEIGSAVRVPVHRLAARFQSEHPEVEHLALFQISASVLELANTAYDQDLRRARARGGEIVIKKAVVARVGKGIADKDRVAELFARYLRDLPGTLASRQTIDALPRTEKGLLELAGYLDAQEEGVRARRARIAEIQSEIDRLAWALYRPEE